MALSYGFYNSVDHDRKYDAIQWGQIFDGIIKDGIYETYKKAMIVKASPNPNYVIVQPGRAWFDHTWSYNDADLPVKAPDPEVVKDRIDALVLDINSELAQRKNSYKWVKGTPSTGTPAKPSNFANTQTHHQYPLCFVYRHADTDTILADDIENAVGTSLCPFVVGVIEGLDIDDLLAQWKAQFSTFMTSSRGTFSTFMTTSQNSFNTWLANSESDFFTWMENEKAAYAAFISHNNTAWTNWFSHIQTELDGDVAGHLQNQIDAISFMYVIDTVLYLPNTGVSISGTKLILGNHN